MDITPPPLPALPRTHPPTPRPPFRPPHPLALHVLRHAAQQRLQLTALAARHRAVHPPALADGRLQLLVAHARVAVIVEHGLKRGGGRQV